MKQVIADANVFLRLFLEDNLAETEQASRLLQKAKLREIRLTVPQITIFEIQFTLANYYNFPKDQVIDKLGTILSTPYLNIQDGRILQDALALYSNSTVGLVDCFMACKAKHAEAELFTFDTNLRKLFDKTK